MEDQNAIATLCLVGIDSMLYINVDGINVVN